MWLGKRAAGQHVRGASQNTRRFCSIAGTRPARADSARGLAPALACSRLCRSADAAKAQPPARPRQGRSTLPLPLHEEPSMRVRLADGGSPEEPERRRRGVAPGGAPTPVRLRRSALPAPLALSRAAPESEARGFTPTCNCHIKPQSTGCYRQIGFSFPRCFKEAGPSSQHL